MSRVIRKGESLTKQCGGCGSLCAFTYGDLNIDDVSGGDDWVVCPECHGTIRLPQSEIPTGWKRLMALEGH